MVTKRTPTMKRVKVTRNEFRFCKIASEKVNIILWLMQTQEKTPKFCNKPDEMLAFPNQPENRSRKTCAKGKKIIRNKQQFNCVDTQNCLRLFNIILSNLLSSLLCFFFAIWIDIKLMLYVACFAQSERFAFVSFEWISYRMSILHNTAWL